MAKHDFYDPIDLHQKELLNVRLQALLNLPPDPFEGQICYHSISSKKLGALYDGTEWRYFGLPPLGKSYESQALMLADQVNQLPDYAYFDGLKEWRKLGTSTGVIADYREIGGGTSIHNDLEGIQGGIEGERYHVNKNVNDALEAGTSPATANPFVTVSALNSYAYVQESPNDGKAYVSKSNVWTQLSPYDLKQEGATDGQALVWSVANSRYQPGTVGGGTGLQQGENALTQKLVLRGAGNWPISGLHSIINSFLSIYDNSNNLVFDVNPQDGNPYFASGRISMINTHVLIDHPSSHWGVPVFSIRTAGVDRFKMMGDGGVSLFDLAVTNFSTTRRAVLNTDFISWGAREFGLKYNSTAGYNYLGKHTMEARNGTFTIRAVNLMAINNTTAHSLRVMNDSSVKTLEILGNHSIYLFNYPTTDPLDSGKLWSDPAAGYALKISQG